MSEKRVVTINPELFKFPTTNKTRKNTASKDTPKIKFKKPEQKPTVSKTIRRNLLNYIRKHQQEKYNELQKKPTTREPPKQPPTQYHMSDFDDSLEYLMKLTKENEKQQQQHHPTHNRTLRHQPHEFGLSSPSKTSENVSLCFPEEVSIPPPPQYTNSPPMYIRPPIQPPQYGCLKNGQLPTYRNWKNHTQKNYGQPVRQPPPTQPQPSTSIQSYKDYLLHKKVEELRGMEDARIRSADGILRNDNESKLKRKTTVHPLASSPQHLMQKEQIKHAKKLENNKAAKIYAPKRQKTIRRTYRVGRSRVAPKISVLVSNKTIRKNIYTQSMLFKQKPIKEVKQYLIKHGFIRVGSIAPNSLLRQMYETAQMMCGEIKNHNPENLLYNFLNGAENDK